ncbi:ABC transporter permease [Lysinimonas soli]|uniref:ABC transporter permease n=1 Tax=Lysinimonas soli TaxID=1074233 RepID=A0ABW0NQ48_9MICO
MNLFVAAFAWIVDPAHWTAGPDISGHLLEHLAVSGLCVLIAVAIALPIGVAIGHTGRGRGAAILISNVARALPTLGLLSILILLLGIGLLPITVVLVILAIPPMLAGAYAGIESVDRQTIDAARALGMTEWQIIVRVEIPLALPLLIGGLRATALQVIATLGIASAFAFGGLGIYLINGLATADYTQLLGGAILITALALVVDGVLALVQRFVIPRGVVIGRSTADGPQKRARAPRPRALQEGMQS